MNNQVQFKNVEPRLLGPMSLLVQGNNNEAAKGIDLVLPAFSWALDLKIFLPVPKALLRSNANEVYRCINQDIEYFIFSPPIMCLSIRFNDQFYEKYQAYIEDKSNFKLMVYIIGYINSPANQENTNSLSNQRENSEQAV